MVPQIDSLWVIAMIITGGIGVIVHLSIIIKTVPQLFSSKIGKKGKTFMFGCILVFILNGIACLFWLLFRTNILFNLSINSCKYIYILNFVCYFIAKYILHCLLIGRIYLTFYGTPYHMKFKVFLIFIAMLSIHIFVTISIWIYQVAPNILKGMWLKHSICTLFSEHADQTLPVTLCAISIGIEDFIVGSITLYILLKRLNNVASGTGDTDLMAKAVRYGVVASIAMISTLFLFTLAVPFYKNVTFIISVDATINSLCIFCVLSIGYKTYYYLCCPFLCCPSKYIGNEPTVTASSTISMIIDKHLAPTKPEKELSAYLGQNEIDIPCDTNTNNNNDNNNNNIIGQQQNELALALTNCSSEPIPITNIKILSPPTIFHSVSDPLF